MQTVADSTPGAQLPALPPEAIKVSGVIRRSITFLESVTEIDDDETFQMVVDAGIACKRQASQLEELRLMATRPIDEAKRKIMDTYRPAVDEGLRGETLSKNLVDAFNIRRRREREEAIRKAEEAARAQRERERQEAAERQRIADEEARAERARVAETQRKEREAREALARADEQQRAAKQRELDEAERVAREARQREADAAERAAERAEDVREIDSAPPPLAIIRASLEPPKAVGASGRKTYKHAVKDKRRLILAAAAELIDGKHSQMAELLRNHTPDRDSMLCTFLSVDEKAVGAIVRSTGGQVRIPGVDITEQHSTAYSSR